jgi:hypothetical protein
MSRLKIIARHFQHYTPLLAIVIGGLLGFMLFSYDKMFQMVLMGAVSVSYVAWGIVHHYIHDDVHFLVILEYVAVAILGMVIVSSLIFRA